MALWAFLISFTPRALDRDDTLPLVSFGVTTEPDGRVLSRARFETWPTLAAAGAFVLALAAYGALRRHWRTSGLDHIAPDRPVAHSRTVLKLGLLLDAMFLVHLGIAQTPARPVGAYIPVLGGALLLVMLYLVWLAVLEAKRTGRLLRHEPQLWAGLVLSLLPPCISFLGFLTGGQL